MAEEQVAEAPAVNTEQNVAEGSILSQEAAPETNANVTEGAETSPLATEAKAEEQVAGQEEKTETEKPEEKAEEKPIEYEPFKLPEGFELDQSMMDKAVPLMQKYGISQEDAQEFVNLQTGAATQQSELLTKAQAEAEKTRVEGWVKELTSDPKYKENLALAQKGAQHLADKVPEAVALMNHPSWGNMPAIFKLAQYVGTMMETEATALNGNQGGKQAERTLADAISPTLKK